jgi:transcriptional regulator with XRE-family HTH domain
MESLFYIDKKILLCETIFMFGIGDVIHQIRKEKRLTFSQMHDLTGVSTTTLLNIENGGNFEKKTLEKIAKGLGFTSDAIYARLQRDRPDHRTPNILNESISDFYVCKNPAHAHLHKAIDSLFNLGDEELSSSVYKILKALSINTASQSHSTSSDREPSMKPQNDSSPEPDSGRLFTRSGKEIRSGRR